MLSPLSLKARNVRLGWDANTEDNLAGYKLYYGKNSRNYTSNVDVGNVLQYLVTGLDDSDYYFTATAYDEEGLESEFSNEVRSSGVLLPLPQAACCSEILLVELAGHWIDTKANNSMVQDDSLFDVDGSTITTDSTQTNIHSHYSAGKMVSGTLYTGRMKLSSPANSIGVTFFSQYPVRDAYYRLRQYNNNDFTISPHGTSVSGDTTTGISAQPDTWYQFKVKVTDTGSQTEILAKVWKQDDTEPDWQINAIDNSPSRLTSGTYGVWSMSLGIKHWDNLIIK